MGALEIVDGNKWLKLLKETSFSTVPLSIAEKIEIALAVTILAFAVIMCYLSFAMSKQFGWNIYKKIGADVQIQSKYPEGERGKRERGGFERVFHDLLY